MRLLLDLDGVTSLIRTNPQHVTIEPNKAATVRQEMPITADIASRHSLQLWSLRNPALYTVAVEIDHWCQVEVNAESNGERSRVPCRVQTMSKDVNERSKMGNFLSSTRTFLSSSQKLHAERRAVRTETRERSAVRTKACI